MKQRNRRNKDKTFSWPVPVFMNRKQIGTMDRRGVISFHDYKTGLELQEKLSTGVYGIEPNSSQKNKTSKTSTEEQFLQFGATLVQLDNTEKEKMFHVKNKLKEKESFSSALDLSSKIKKYYKR